MSDRGARGVERRVKDVERERERERERASDSERDSERARKGESGRA